MAVRGPIAHVSDNSAAVASAMAQGRERRETTLWTRPTATRMRNDDADERDALEPTGEDRRIAVLHRAEERPHRRPRGERQRGQQELVEVPAALDGAVRRGEEHRNELGERDARAEGGTRRDVTESAPALIVVREADGRRERQHDRLVHELRDGRPAGSPRSSRTSAATARHGREECMTAWSATSSIGIQAITRICSNWTDFDSVDPAAMAMSAAAVAPIRVMPSRRPSSTMPTPNNTTWPATRTPIARFVPNASVRSCGG